MRTPLHSEWKLFREQQTFKVDRVLWDAITESIIGHKIDDPQVLVPSLNRVLYDSLRGTDTRYGLGPGQAFVDQKMALDTIVFHISGENGPFDGFGGPEFLTRYDLTDPESIEQMMGDLYEGVTVEQLNFLFFELLMDAFSLKREYRNIFKTSWVSLQIVRDLATSNPNVIEFDEPEGCLLVPGTTTTTRPPSPIDDVDVVGCAAFTTTTTTSAPTIEIVGDLTDAVCCDSEYEEVLQIVGGDGTYVSVDVVEGTAPPWMTFQIVGDEIRVGGTPTCITINGNLSDATCCDVYDGLLTVSGGSGTYVDLEVTGDVPPWMTFQLTDGEIVVGGSVTCITTTTTTTTLPPPIPTLSGFAEYQFDE